jgi:SAM-dependent methyltransferase
MADSMQVFDRRAVRAHRDRAAASFAAHGFLFAEIAQRLAERRDDLGRAFPVSLALGARGGGGATFTADLSAALRPDVVCDEEALPFGAATLDLIVSCLALHWVNDLPGALVQVRRALKPGGLFLAAMLGGDTLIELRHAFLEADAATTGGASPHTSPMAELADLSALMQRAGFKEPVTDLDTLTVTYPDALSLMRELRAMGESGAALARRRCFTRRATLLAACERYAALYADASGRVPATFQVVTLTGWA